MAVVNIKNVFKGSNPRRTDGEWATSEFYKSHSLDVSPTLNNGVMITMTKIAPKTTQYMTAVLDLKTAEEVLGVLNAAVALARTRSRP
jgi:hypothetical protein